MTVDARAESLPGRPADAVRADEGRGGGQRAADRDAAPSVDAAARQVEGRRCRRSRRWPRRSARRRSAPGDAITDTVKVTGLGGLTATIQAALYGPYPTREPITCADAPVWTGTLDGHRRRRLRHRAGHADHARLLHLPRVDRREPTTIAGVQTACADVAETTIVRAAPAVVTQISAQETAPGAADHRHAWSSAASGKLGATVNVELWGPFATRDAISCEGTPVWTGTLAGARRRHLHHRARHAPGGRLLHLPRVDRRERGRPRASATACGEATETTLAQGRAGRSRRSSRTRWSSRTAQIFDTPDGHRPRQDAGDRRPSTCSARTRRATTSTARARRTGRARSTSPATASLPVAEGDGPARRVLRLPRAHRRRRDSSPPPRASAPSRPRPRSPRR